MRTELFFIRSHATEILTHLLDAGFSIGPAWANEAATFEDAIEMYVVTSDDDQTEFWKHLKATLDEVGYCVDYHDCVYPSHGFGWIVKAMGISNRDAMLLSELVIHKDSIASMEEHDLLASYEREARSRKLFHANLTAAVREFKRARGY